MIDLRSDTVTKPTQEMREAMVNAEVGDDVFGEDPTVNQLETYCANLFGKEAALFCSSGTQTNQIAIAVHTKPGGEVICDEESHIYKYEGGGIARNSLASVRLLRGDRGRLSVNQVSAYFNNPLDIHLPLTQLVSIEDTVNRGGGAIYDFTDIQNISSWCKDNHTPLHLDGARIFNALVENGIDYQKYASQYDSMSICLSKGLGAPVGSILLGSSEFIHKSRRVRKVLGGGMRQAGIIAAAGLYAIKHNIDRLKVDHENAKILETELNTLSWVDSVLPVETNIVVVHLKDPNKRDQIIEELKNQHIAAMAFGPGMIRLVTHLGIQESDISYCCEKLKTLKGL